MKVNDKEKDMNKDEIKRLLQKENIPEIIYKYMPINEFNFKNLLNNSIWFSNPISFNDPFDCKMFKLVKSRKKKFVEFLKKEKEKGKAINFEKEALLEINFGCELQPTDDDVKDIIKLVESCNYPNVKFMQTIKRKDRFGFKFEEIKI